MQFWILSQVDPGYMYYMGCRCPDRKGHFAVSDRFKSIVKHRILVWVNCELCKNSWTDLNDVYLVMTCFCARSCLLEVAMIAPALKFLVALILLSQLIP